MLTFGYYVDTNTYLYAYMFIYNISLTLLFWTFFNLILSGFKTLHSLSTLSFNSFFVLAITVILLSMAGVPPFIGFFSKLFIIILLVNNSFFLLYSLFFITLLLGLYFYVQNIRFLHSTNQSTADYVFLFNERHVPIFYYTVISLMWFMLMGFVYIDDIYLIFLWIFS